MVIPNGKIIAIGGAEDKGTKPETGKPVFKASLPFLENGLLRRIVDEAGGSKARIEIVTTASVEPHKVGDQYYQSFRKFGCTDVGIMHIRNRKEITHDHIERMKACDCVMFSGGTQMRLAQVFRKTEFLNVAIHRYQHENLLIAGTSAGAMAMSGIMIYKGPSLHTYLKGQVKTVKGFNLMHRVVFDSHFEKGGRFMRLAQVVAINPSYLGVGMCEDTGVLITDGNCMEVIGRGLVVFIDGHDIQYSNLPDIEEGFPVSIESLQVHFCVSGDKYILNERKMVGKNVLHV